MEIIRQFKKMNLWDFIELMQSNCLNCGEAKTYFMYLDEIKMRRIESISEGGNHKLKNLALELLESFQNEISKNPDFCSEAELNEFQYIVENEI